MYKIIKSISDILVATILFIVSLPFLLFFTIMLAISNSGKPFFTQKRIGKNNKEFKVIKFKTMNDKKDNNGRLLPDKDRLTKIGSFVRKTSIDELPQLLNILKGDMSFIGPRPLLVRYLPYYTEKELLRHTIKPGISGWAQVNGRNTVGWNERLEFDVYYVKNISFILDIKIVFLTIKNIIYAKNIVTDPTSLMKDLDEERK